MTALKTSIPKGKGTQNTYRDCKKFDSLKLNDELKKLLTNENIDNCTKFDEKFLEVLDKHATLKRKLLRANHASYVYGTCMFTCMVSINPVLNSFLVI